MELRRIASDRTKAYGRNLLAVGATVLVLKFAPGIEITNFEPFGFEITPNAESTIWGIFLITLIYYGVRYWVDVRIDITEWYDQMRDAELRIAGILRGENQVTLENTTPGHVNRVALSQKYRIVWQFWALDFAPPALIFAVAFLSIVIGMM